MAPRRRLAVICDITVKHSETKRYFITGLGMRILFWNTGGRSVTDLLREVSRRRELDVLVLAEAADPMERLVSQLNRDAEWVYFSAPDPLAEAVKRPLRIITRFPGNRIRAVRDGDGVTVKRIFPVIGPDFTLVAVHLGSKLFRNQDDQVSGAWYVNEDIDKVERQVGHRRTLVIGDFNMNPFERGLVNFNCFHAVMSRDTARGRSRTSAGRERYFFYNPMWNHLGDRPPGPPGSYYRRGSGQTEYFWHLFDQVLLRPDLLDYFVDDGLEVLTRIGQQSLLNQSGIPDSGMGSDHLPLFLELSIERGVLHGIA